MQRLTVLKRKFQLYSKMNKERIRVVSFSDGSFGGGSGGRHASRHVRETEECEGVVFT